MPPIRNDDILTLFIMTPFTATILVDADLTTGDADVTSVEY